MMHTVHSVECQELGFIIKPMIHLNDRLVNFKGVEHLGHDEAMKAGGRDFEPRPGHYIVG